MKWVATATAGSAAALIALGFQQSAAAQATDPIVLVKAIYAQSEKGCNTPGSPPPDLRKIAGSHFEAALAGKYLAAMKRNKIDFDVIVDGQDCKLSAVTVTEKSKSADGMTVRATFRNFDRPSTVDVVWRKGDSGWRIADITYGHRKFSLRKSVGLP